MTSQHQSIIDPTRLAPEDAYIRSPPSGSYNANVSDGHSGNMRNATRRSKTHYRNRSRNRRKKPASWKKLLWVKHPYPDNYTDEATFLDHLQRNPRLQPYEFWPLVADSMVIVQQVCAVIVFVCCFSGIIQERVSPITVVSCGSICTVLGWILWDAWCGKEESLRAAIQPEDVHDEQADRDVYKDFNGSTIGLGLDLPQNSSTMPKKTTLTRDPSASSVQSVRPSENNLDTRTRSPKIPIAYGSASSSIQSQMPPSSRFSPRNQQRLATVKSALLIYCALLGLSPILKSLTKSTASDSIWAISFWLMCINIFFFDYGSGVGPTFPASLSTNAALMASTVLASRLPSTTQVFSLTLFSIEVFGLFPIFRKYLRYISSRGHALLTCLLVMGAGGGVATSISSGGWKPSVIGVVLGCILTGFAMGLCSLWLIGLQRYKNEIHGPWDPARPIIRRRWD